MSRIQGNMACVIAAHTCDDGVRGKCVQPLEIYEDETIGLLEARECNMYECFSELSSL